MKRIRDYREGRTSDLYGVLAYVAFALAPISRQDRINGHKTLVQREA